MSAFTGKTLMITGGTGSFGNTVLKPVSYTHLFVGLSLIAFFYLFINSKEQKVYSKQKVLLYMSALVVLLSLIHI